MSLISKIDIHNFGPYLNVLIYATLLVSNNAITSNHSLKSKIKNDINWELNATMRCFLKVNVMLNKN